MVWLGLAWLLLYCYYDIVFVIVIVIVIAIAIYILIVVVLGLMLVHVLCKDSFGVIKMLIP
jgi:hypothetical protein